ncbi:hypothetical protein [Paenibacillus glycanilyticus]|uniref:hypothetical protein n=1 Tax=Paenibacillus glycanilyticus TaxID=126569 RepID=UPI003EBA3FF3
MLLFAPASWPPDRPDLAANWPDLAGLPQLPAQRDSLTIRRIVKELDWGSSRWLDDVAHR